MKSNFLSPIVSFILTPLLAVSPIWAQTAAPASTTAGQTVSGADLKVDVSENDGPEAAVNSNTIKGFTVHVSDVAGAPVPEAAVALRLPDNGPSGTFADGTRAAVLYTDTTGTVRFTRLHWGQTPGPVSLRITAAKGDAHAGILLSETLTASAAPLPATAIAANPIRTPPELSPATNLQTTRVLGQIAPAPPQFAVAMPNPAISTAPSAPLPLPAVSVTRTGASQSDSPATNQLASTTIAKPEPTVSVTGASPDAPAHHSGKTKWIILGAVAVAAGAGFAAVGKGKPAPTAAAAPSLSIGAPSISIGHS